jgi:hypothetical protein
MTVRMNFKAIKPGPFNNQAVSDTLRDKSKEWAELFKDEQVEPVTDGWEGEKPEWSVQVYWANQYQLGFRIVPLRPDDKGSKKFLWLDEGTKGPYPIRAKNAKTLAFPSIYNAGSTPGSLTTFRGVSSGPTVFVPMVMHPGIKPRNFTREMVKIGQKDYEEYMASAMYEVAKATGHSMD